MALTKIIASMVSFVQAGAGTLLRTAQDKFREMPSLTDFAGATAQAQFDNAKANGVRWLRIPSGTYSITRWNIAESDTLDGLLFDRGARLVFPATLNNIGLDIQKSLFRIRGEAWVDSAGTPGDGMNTTCIRFGDPAIVGKAYIDVERYNVNGASKRGLVFYQPVFVQVGGGRSQSCKYSFSVEPALGIGGSVVKLGPTYTTACSRAINLEMCSYAVIEQPVVEYCGETATSDGALHFVSCGKIAIHGRYAEANLRNMVKTDAGVVFYGGDNFAATAADIKTYVGAAEVDRGTTEITSSGIYASRLGWDRTDNRDLQIGPTLPLGGMVVPKTGASAQWCMDTKWQVKGTLTNATWTTVAAIPATEMTGATHQKASYKVTCYAGFADLSTGFVSGTIINNVLYMDGGIAIPAWLRFDAASSSLQMLVTSSSYGLLYNVVLTRTFPGP